MGGIVDEFIKFIFGESKTEHTYRQDRYSGSRRTGEHEHTWSKTTTSGGGQHKHKEGWVGSKAPRNRKR